MDTEIKKHVWVTSDAHFFHKNILKYDNRPFKDVHEMHDTIIKNWNSVVQNEDTVYYLGDVSYGSVNQTKGILNQLKGKIILIRGNHDKDKWIDKYKDRFESVHHYLELNINKQMYVLMHYPILSFNKIYRGSIHICGHSHGNLQPIYNKQGQKLTAKRIDVGCMNHNYYPINLERVHELVDNINFKPVDHHE
jgi:calcineurin-like phosphoesterase family protein